jgi:hypothetical protein
MGDSARMKDNNAPQGPVPKRIYKRPTLNTYGTLRDITRTVGNTSAKNDGGGGNTKTA